MICKTKIRFYSGFDPVCPVPKLVERTGLMHRLAIVQETYRPDSHDMYLDKPLWFSLLQFASNYTPDVRVGVVDRPYGARRRQPTPTDEKPLEAYLSTKSATPSGDDDPAEFVMVRDAGKLLLCIATEFWTEVGGPAPYADSYTYSIFSLESLVDRMPVYLAAARPSAGWLLAETVLPAPQTRKR